MKTLYFHTQNVKDYIINHLTQWERTTKEDYELIQTIQKYMTKPLIFDSQNPHNQTILTQQTNFCLKQFSVSTIVFQTWYEDSELEKPEDENPEDEDDYPPHVLDAKPLHLDYSRILAVLWIITLLIFSVSLLTKTPTDPLHTSVLDNSQTMLHADALTPDELPPELKNQLSEEFQELTQQIQDNTYFIAEELQIQQHLRQQLRDSIDHVTQLEETNKTLRNRLIELAQ